MTIDLNNVGPAEILEILPHRPPFLFLDRVDELHIDKKIIAHRDLRLDEPHYEGHFPGRPIMPGVLITEALAQAAGLLLALSSASRGEAFKGRIFYLARSDTKWTEAVSPPERLILEARVMRSLGELTVFAVRASTEHKDVAGGTLTLAEVTDRSKEPARERDPRDR